MNYISSIRQDNKSGARELEELVRRAIYDFISHPYKKKSFLNFLNKLKSAKPEMTAIAALTGEIENKIKNLKNIKELNREIKSLLAVPSIDWEILTKKASKLVHKKRNVLTYSYSSTVLEVLIRLKKFGFTVFVPESRPVFEGRKMALELQKTGIKVKFLTDAGVSRIIRDIDIVLLGADSFSKNYVINKTGTFAIALLSREFKIPCYVICGKNKFLNNSLSKNRNACFTLNESPKKSKEIWSTKGIEIINYYFESVPIKYFTGIVTD